MSEELKPCPCGSKAEKTPYAITLGNDLFRLDCIRAECGWAVIAPSIEQAFIDWNIRAELSALSPAGGVILPERMTCEDGYPSDDWIAASAYNRCLDEVARLNPCRAQAVPNGWKSIALYADQLADMVLKGDAPHTAQRIAMALRGMLAAAPSAKKESGYYSDQDWINAGCPRNEESE